MTAIGGVEKALKPIHQHISGEIHHVAHFQLLSPN